MTGPVWTDVGRWSNLTVDCVPTGAVLHVGAGHWHWLAYANVNKARDFAEGISPTPAGARYAVELACGLAAAEEPESEPSPGVAYEDVSPWSRFTTYAFRDVPSHPDLGWVAHEAGDGVVSVWVDNRWDYVADREAADARLRELYPPRKESAMDAAEAREGVTERCEDAPLGTSRPAPRGHPAHAVGPTPTFHTGGPVTLDGHFVQGLDHTLHFVPSTPALDAVSVPTSSLPPALPPMPVEPLAAERPFDSDHPVCPVEPLTGRDAARARLLTPLTDEEAADLPVVTSAEIDAALRLAEVRSLARGVLGVPLANGAVGALREELTRRIDLLTTCTDLLSSLLVEEARVRERLAARIEALEQAAKPVGPIAPPLGEHVESLKERARIVHHIRELRGLPGGVKLDLAMMVALADWLEGGVP